MKLKTGTESTSRMGFNNTRGLPFHGMGAFVGTGKTQRAHVYTAASIPVDPEAYKKIDPKKLAEELEVDMCAVNQRPLLDDGRNQVRSSAKRRTSTVSSCAGAGT